MPKFIGLAYLRESQEDRDSKENSEDFVTTSIKNQEFDARKEALSDGINSIEIFKDVNVHSTDTKRKEFQRMLEWIKIKKLQVEPSKIRIYIKDYTRLGRGNAFFDLRRKIMFLEIPIENIFFYYEQHWKVLRNNETEPIRVNNEPDSIVMIKVGANLIQIEKARKDTLALQSRKMGEGLPYIKAPFGYEYSGRKGEKFWVIHKTKSLIVKDIFQMTLDGVDYKEICKKYKLLPPAYYKIIKNKNYLGLICHNKKIKLDDGTVIRKEKVEYKGNFEPLISEELFNAVQQKLKNNKIGIARES